MHAETPTSLHHTPHPPGEEYEPDARAILEATSIDGERTVPFFRCRLIVAVRHDVGGMQGRCRRPRALVLTMPCWPAPLRHSANALHAPAGLCSTLTAAA